MFWRRAQPTEHHVDFSGHFERTAFAVGDYAVANTYNGTVIQHFAAGTAPRPTRRPSPQSRPPRDPVELLGREAELELVDAMLRSASAVVLHGASGVGKTVLLKHVAANIRDSWPDGVLYANVGAQQLEDVLQWLFTVFWDTGEVVYAPGSLGVGEYLADVQALVVLDDIDLDSADVERLLGGARGSGFVLGAAQPRSAGTQCRLGGLDTAAAARLFARVLGRAVSEVQRPDVDAFVARVEGLPGFVVTGAQLVRDGVCTPRDLRDEAGVVLARRRLLALPAEQQELLGLLAELAPAPITGDRLAADAEGRFEGLRAAGLVERHSPRYTLTGAIDATAARALPHMGSPEFLRHLAAEAERVGAHDAPTVVAALAWGQRDGQDQEVLRAARALAPSMMKAGCTGAWQTVAEFGLAAARRLERLTDEALFLHEQGTRLGCLGEHDDARTALTRARDIRRRLGDDDAAAVSDHNLRQLFGDPGGNDTDGSNRGGGGDGGRRPPGLPVVAVLALVGVALLVVVVLATRGGSERIVTIPAPIASTAPKIVITSPADGAIYQLGTRIRARYSCTNARQCRGDVNTGVPVNGRPGTHPFTVRATGADGAQVASTATYTVKPGVASKSVTIVITSPADGATYQSGTRIRARYSCTNARQCRGDVRVGVPVNGRPGTHVFTVRASSVDGARVAGTATYTVKPGVPSEGPKIVITSPAHGATYDSGTAILADYQCTNARSCAGNVKAGEAINSDPGSHSFTVRATGSDGPPVDRTVTYTVTSAPSDPLEVEASAIVSKAGFVSLAYGCSGGTAPLRCTATLDGEPAEPGATVGCGRHAVVVRVTDAVGAEQKRQFNLNGGDCRR